MEVTVRAKNDYLPAEISLRKEKEILEVVHDKDSITQRIGVDAGEGFIFGLYCQDDIRYADGTQMADTLMATGITDANGMLTFTGMYPHGRYYIKEMAAAEGWKLSAEPFSVTIPVTVQSCIGKRIKANWRQFSVKPTSITWKRMA